MEEKTIIEKYKPNSIEELKLPSNVLKLVNKNKERDGYRFLFHGSPGLGKTTLAFLLNKNTENKKYDVLYLSGSNEFNTELMRKKVYPFISNHSVLGKQKTLIIDEAENISDKIQDSFKIILDKATNVNFIFITNEVAKINSAVKSRSTNIEFVFTDNEFIEQQNNYLELLLKIVTEEKLPFKNNGLKQLYIKNFPDIRKSLIEIQSLKDKDLEINSDNVLNLSDIGVQNLDLYKVIEDIKIDSQKFYTEITKYKGKEDDCFKSLSEPYFRYLNSNGKFEQTLKAAIIIAKYSNMHQFSTSKFGNFLAMVVELRTLFR